ncbi:MAG: DUF5677 domain-containing protein [Bacteroidota bacterium]|nr:DUF5677 domain-containing protein [Bacteroidota bacterium]MDP4233821.1 DUF5677 domain-containing protein [Bacteroidota bacterium]MDP4242480.1 DUF5677 domain-containing protein [Bacteroidota bacterium]MDP4289042.1 DUF5677 domain-containing protein [Bacteroidota bacterium]
MDDKEFTRLDEARATIDVVCVAILFDIALNPSVDVTMIRNFIAKSVMIVRSIFNLWKISAFQECHILQRCLVDRLLYLRKLIAEDGFDDFEEWSFVEQYDFQMRLRADGRFKHRTSNAPPIPESDKMRRKELKKKKMKWQIPNPSKMAEEIERDYLYLFSYDYGSMHIHPIATDGQQDFYTLTKLETSIEFPSNDFVLTNAVHILWLIVTDAIHYKDWPIAHELKEFFESFLECLESGSEQYRLDFLALAKRLSPMEAGERASIVGID